MWRWLRRLMAGRTARDRSLEQVNKTLMHAREVIDRGQRLAEATRRSGEAMKKGSR